MEPSDRERMEHLLYETTLGMLRFDPEAHKDEQGNWKPVSAWSKADASCITEVSSTCDKKGNHKVKLKFVSRKQVLRTAREVLKAGRPKSPVLQKLHDEIKELVESETQSSKGSV